MRQPLALALRLTLVRVLGIESDSQGSTSLGCTKRSLFTVVALNRVVEAVQFTQPGGQRVI